MRHFPIFVNMDAARVLLSGGGDAALAKLRLLMKTSARIEVYTTTPAPELSGWARDGAITLHLRPMTGDDAKGATLIYAADEDPNRDADTRAMATHAGVLSNIVDNLDDSDFITPAMIDRDPVCIAIGTEGAAPMLARSIKADLEENLPASLGLLTRAAQAFRKAAEALPHGRRRRAFWAEYFNRTGPDAFDADGDQALAPALSDLLDRHLGATAQDGRITLTWTGSDDPDLLTLKARKAIDTADVVIHDAGIAPAILELARREARFIALERPTDVPPMPQLLTGHAAKGAHVVYLSCAPIPAALIAGCRTGDVTVTTIPGLPAAHSAADRPTTDLKETA